MSTQAALGQKALEERKYDEAITHLTDALKSSQSPLWLIQRSTALQRLSRFQEALRDADQAVVVATSRARREQIATAQFRRGVALYGLKRYADAAACFTWSTKLNEKEKGVDIWQVKVKAELEKLAEDAPERKVSVKELPDEVSVDEGHTSAAVEAKNTEKSAQNAPVASPAATIAAKPVPQQTPIDKIKHDWYQSSNKVTITIMAKGVPKDKAEIELEQKSVSVSFPHASGSTYNFTLDPLYGEIDVSQSTYNITPHKIELNLHKSLAGLKWSSLEGTADTAGSASAQISTVPTPPVDKAPAYPTSSRKGTKDWDKLATESLGKLKEKPKKEDDTGKKTEDHTHDDDDDDFEGGDEVNNFFKKLYASADPDTRRAMMKSFTESNGTALSTNWADVGTKTFETSPPEGVEARKW